MILSTSRIMRGTEDKHFKLPFSLIATVSPARQAVNRTAVGENFPLSMTIRIPKPADFHAV
jgi:hypothetical protein